MIGADDIRALTEKGAESVRVVGCPRADCVYGVGNLSFKRGSMAPAAPDLPRRWRALAGTDWAAPGHVARAVVRPGDATDPDARHLPPGRSGLTKAGLVVVASVPVVAVATLAPYRPETVAGGELAVLVEHVPGRSLVGLDQPTGVSGRPATLRVTIDGGAREFGMRPAGADGPETNLAWVRLPLDVGSHRVEVSLLEGEQAPTVAWSGLVAVKPGDRRILEVPDLPPPPGPELGRSLPSRPSSARTWVARSVIRPNQV
jgi:hypothetical protein